MEVSSVFSTKSAAGIFMGVLLFFYALLRVLSGIRFSFQRRKLPPEAGGGWPVIGHLHLLGGSEALHRTLANMADEYGPIFRLKMGMHRVLVVSNWEIARECFGTNDRIFASRPKLMASKLLGYNSSMFGFSPYGPYWRHIRKIATLQILSNHRLDQLQHIRVSEVQTSIKKLYELWMKNKDQGDQKVLVEMKTWFGDLTINTILRMVVGKRFSTAFEGSGTGQQYQKALRNFLELFGIFVPSDSFPFLSWLDLGGHEKAMKKTAKELDQLLDKWLNDHRQRKISSEMEEEAKDQDFMDLMLSTVKDDGQLSNYDVDTVIKATCLNLILGGSDTTQVTMTWALSLLLNHEDVLKKAQLELDEQVGRERLVEESDVKNLLYLQAIVKETMRLYPAAPLAAMHEAMEDCTVAGYHIPAKTRLMVNIQKLQRDPLVWEDPYEFRPERFLTTQKDFDVRGQTPQLIPFGSGRRICPGISFALQITYLTLANLLHGFEIRRPSHEPIDMEDSIGLTSIKITPLEVVLAPRLLSAHVYQ